MTTPELIGSLNAGDTVALSRPGQLGDPLVGQLVESGGHLFAGPHLIRWHDGTPAVFLRSCTLTVTARAHRPGTLYANHPRPLPAVGDIARDAEGSAWQRGRNIWLLAGGGMPGATDIDDCAPLTLLWDALVGQAVGGAR